MINTFKAIIISILLIAEPYSSALAENRYNGAKQGTQIGFSADKNSKEETEHLIDENKNNQNTTKYTLIILQAPEIHDNICFRPPVINDPINK